MGWRGEMTQSFFNEDILLNEVDSVQSTVASPAAQHLAKRPFLNLATPPSVPRKHLICQELAVAPPVFEAPAIRPHHESTSNLSSCSQSNSAWASPHNCSVMLSHWPKPLWQSGNLNSDVSHYAQRTLPIAV